MNVDKLEEKMNLSGNAVHFYELIKLLGNTIALCHVVGTGYYFLARCEYDYLKIENTWIRKGLFLHLADKYLVGTFKSFIG